MFSIFDEEEFERHRPTRYVVPLLAPQAVSQGYIIPSSAPRLMYRISNKRKRTVSEALERLPGPIDLPDIIEETQIGRTLRKPLMIYEAARWIAMGLIIVDPLDRLEGGIID